MKIRPAYRFGLFAGFSLHNGVEPIGCAMSWKACALLLRQLEAK